MSKPKSIRFYNKANRDLHCEERYRQLCADARLVLMHLILCPETTPLPGLVRIRRSTLIEDLPMTPRRFAAAWSQLEALAYVKADWDAGLVWIVDGLEHNPPENPNTVRGWSKHLPLLPHCALRIEAQQQILVSLSRRGEGFAESAREVLESGGMVSGGFGEPGAGSGSGSGTGTGTGGGETRASHTEESAPDPTTAAVPHSPLTLGTYQASEDGHRS